jgi:hypothetical protein
LPGDRLSARERDRVVRAAAPVSIITRIASGRYYGRYDPNAAADRHENM